MPLVVNPSDDESQEGAVPCSDQLLIRPNVPLHQGCPVLTKSPSLTIVKGQEGTVEWIMRDADGNPVDLTTCLGVNGTDGEVAIRIRDALGGSCQTHEVTGTVTDAAGGVVRFEIPEEVASTSCIYYVEIGILNSSGKLIFSNKSLLSVEPGLFGSTEPTTAGPITLEMIRMEMRDRAPENDLLLDVEFDDVEIVSAILMAIREWNETPPRVAVFTPCNFPYLHFWLSAVCGRLLRSAAVWYERNNAEAAGGGVAFRDRAKSNPYLAMSERYMSEWKAFIKNEKQRIDLESCWGGI